MPSPSPAPTRRDFLRAGSAASVALLGAPLVSAAPTTAQRCILLCLTGGPSQFETWDPKPDAPAEVRGPFGTIATSVPGVRLGEHLPRSAALAHRFTIVRCVHHEAAPVHEAGWQLLQTGALSSDGIHPHLGALLAHQGGAERSFVVLPGPLGHLGLEVSRGQGAGTLGSACEPVMCRPSVAAEPAPVRERFGRNTLGDCCLAACRLVEKGVRCVTVNMFDRLAERVTWDCHAAPPSLPATLDDYRRTLCPMFDLAFAALLEELHQRGLLETTLVAVLGEMGRTPRVNAAGGRDHWTRAWSIVLAGGGMPAGAVVGATDRTGAEPVDTPLSAAEVHVLLRQALQL
jgi:hypothetical protein